MPHSPNIDFYLGSMEDESLADALADFEDPLDGRASDFFGSIEVDEEFSEDELRLDYDDY